MGLRAILGLDATQRASAPAAAATGRRLLYAKSDGWYQMDASGVEKKLGGAATYAATAPSNPTLGELWVDTSLAQGTTAAAQIRSGNIAPASGVGALGDWYINYSTWDVYEKTSATVWTLRGNIKGAAGAAGSPGTTYTPPAWATYTPTWTAPTTNPAVGNGSITGRWQQMGKTTHFWILLTAGSTTTFGSGVFQFGLPATARTADSVIGTAFQTGANMAYTVRSVSTTTVSCYMNTTFAGMSATNGGMLTTGILRISGTYEAL